MLTKDDVQKAQKDQNAEKTGVLKDQMAAAQKTDALNGQKIDSHNYSLDDVLLGKRVKIARKEKRLTQEELAGQLGCNFGIDFHLWVNTWIVHNEVVHTFSQKNTDFE